ncbi:MULTISPECIES: pyridoxal phosphate-dependent aminotransferase [Rhodanobacter]|uniref:Aminotransferase n=1 Tax=Rhodanobacter denitrificans TaxID=666685 RepID=M4NGA7_9GAMM|nr:MULTISPECIES: pyridoxal phosphate-dependent aminotransferase [Rhodanobacter]AGG88683.1 aspartate/tyrosine/aromatic aminotransferase [Rhodanobacter denitrificans]KZC20437.1 aminotransferase [Rhodanobacter denitrificans]UJJ52564.1 pyridoxal phosphate-dependent aminotransferase [Rhodanobacter denitrificans]UJJ58649.1 pyridoxal phosphate-dependent aminotransferase [Rhodanobacter denitrificans]UJM87818.1 pyridoxal phosphate-dependent aminotransferase [Rhodanobacter denitrificans]
MPQLAQRVGRAKPSAIMVIAEKAKQLKAAGRDIISFSIGVPNFLPGEHVYAAARESLSRDSGQYGSNRGAEALLDAFLRHIEALGFSGYTRMNLSIGIGAKQVLYNLAEALLDEGDEICFAAPYWTTYRDIADIVGAKVHVMHCGSEQNYKLTPAQLDAALARKPKVFLFNNPSNPTGMVYTAAEIAALADVLAKHPDTWVITDDIYNAMVFDGLGYHNFVHAQPALRERVIFVDSVSKTYGMPGWRVGLLAGPESVAKAVTTLNSNHITSLPEVITAAAVAALSGPQDIPRAKCAEFADRRDTVFAALSAIPGVVCPRPQGAFYAFPDISSAFGKSHGGTRITNDVEFCAALLEAKGVACVPGSAFGEPRAMRISYTCPAAQLQPGLQRIQQFFAELT